MDTTRVLLSLLRNYYGLTALTSSYLNRVSNFRQLMPKAETNIPTHCASAFNAYSWIAPHFSI